MLILHNSPKKDEDSKIVVLFGTGLLGAAFLKSLHRSMFYKKHYIPSTWNNYELFGQGLDAALSKIIHIVDQYEIIGLKTKNLAFVWCAGKAGFNASEIDYKHELNCFDAVLQLASRVYELLKEYEVQFHMISSAGGLFEGQRVIDCATVPKPKRVYGLLKHEQEIRLKCLPVQIGKMIYRPTSVYGYNRDGQRMGLIPILIANGLENRVSTIFGDFSTLRDYVLNEDVGAFIAQNLFTKNMSQNLESYLLGSGKPSSIYEIKHFVERAIGKKIYFKFENNSKTSNSSDITIALSARPEQWAPTSLQNGVRYVKEKIMIHPKK
jgi:hypothetical protein